VSIYLIQLAVCGVVELIVWFAVAVFDLSDHNSICWAYLTSLDLLSFCL